MHHDGGPLFRDLVLILKVGGQGGLRVVDRPLRLAYADNMAC